jgi:hypothetical protein
MAQRYLPEIVDGDKRILMIDGEPVPYALARIPAGRRDRGNLAAGGTARRAAQRARPLDLRPGRPGTARRGLLFVGPGRDRRLASPRSTSPARPASANSTPSSALNIAAGPVRPHRGAPGLAPMPIEASAPRPATRGRASRADQHPTEYAVRRADHRELNPTPPTPLPTSRQLIERSLEMARLAAELERQTQAYAKRPKKKVRVGQHPGI